MVNYLLISENYNKADCDEHTVPGEFLLKQLENFPLILDASPTKLACIKEYIRLHLNDDVRYVIYQDKRCSCSCICLPSNVTKINDYEKSIKKITAIVYEELNL